jgi:hypothetical protein
VEKALLNAAVRVVYITIVPIATQEQSILMFDSNSTLSVSEPAAISQNFEG